MSEMVFSYNTPSDHWQKLEARLRALIIPTCKFVVTPQSLVSMVAERDHPTATEDSTCK